MPRFERISEEARASARIKLEQLSLEQKERLRKIIRMNFYMVSSQNQLEFLYNLTKKDVIAIMILQNGLCDLCGKELEGKWDVDHNHETGRVRGLLHPRCNRGLGQLGDNIQGLQNGIDYLKRHGET